MLWGPLASGVTAGRGVQAAAVLGPPPGWQGQYKHSARTPSPPPSQRPHGLRPQCLHEPCRAPSPRGTAFQCS